jgi:O-antigen ligase
MARRLDLILVSVLVFTAVLCVALGAGTVGPAIVVAPAAAAAVLVTALSIDLRRLVLLLTSAMLALVAYAPAIGVTPENLLYGLPLYGEVWGGLTPLELILIALLGLASVLRVRAGPPPRATVSLVLFMAFGSLIAVAFLRGNGAAALTEFRLLLPLFMSFTIGWLLLPGGNTLRWIGFGILFGVLAGGVRAILLHALHLGFRYGDFLRVSVDTGDYLFQVFALVWLFLAWLVGGRRWAAILLPFVTAALIFSFARGAWMVALSALTAVIFVGVVLGRGRMRSIGWALPLAAASVLVVAGVSGEGRRMEERMATVLDWQDHDPNVYRLIETRNAMQSIQEKPWWGGGLGAQYRGEVALRRSAHVPITTLVHNNVLWLGLKGGITLAASFTALLLAVLWVSMRRGLKAAEPEARLWYLATFGILCGYLALSLVGALVQHVRDNVLLGLLLGLAASSGRETAAVLAQQALQGGGDLHPERPRHPHRIPGRE